MIDAIETRKGQRCCDIMFNQLKMPIATKMRNILSRTRHKIIEAKHAMVLVKKRIAEMAADESSAAAHKRGKSQELRVKGSLPFSTINNLKKHGRIGKNTIICQNVNSHLY